MKKRIIYSTEVSVSNMILEAEKGMKICSEEVKEEIYPVTREESYSA